MNAGEPRVRRRGSDCRMMDMSKDVPPMSQATASEIFSARHTARAPTTPAAGPDSARTAGARRPSATEIEPPPE